MPGRLGGQEDATVISDIIRIPSPSDRFLIISLSCIVAPEVDTTHGTGRIQDHLLNAIPADNALAEANYRTIDAITIPKSPLSRLVSNPTTSNEEIEGDSPIPYEEIESEKCNLNSTKGGKPSQAMKVLLYYPKGSLEELRCRRAASYECSVLDEYLMKHSRDA